MTKYNTHENDTYLIQNNKLQIKELDELMKAEAVAFSLRAMEIEQGKYSINNFSLDGLKQLHHYLFQDVYQFAGEIRDVQLMKGTTRFCQFQYINEYAVQFFEGIIVERSWHSIDEAANRLAYFKSELNMLHPFREGNGRTIRIFLHFFAKERGFYWAYDEMDREEYIGAMIQSVTNIDKLTKIFIKTIYHLT